MIEAIDFTGPRQQANHLARYITDASAIRAHCVNNWGGAPTLQEIKDMQALHQRRNAGPKIGEPTVSDGVVHRIGILSPPPSKPIPAVPAKPLITKKVAKVTLWPKWYKPPIQMFCIHTLIASVAKDFGVEAAEITGKSRLQHVVRARAVIRKLLKERGWSYPRIARVTGGTDHSTVIHAVRSFDIYQRQDERVDQSYGAHKAAGW